MWAALPAVFELIWDCQLPSLLNDQPYIAAVEIGSVYSWSPLTWRKTNATPAEETAAAAVACQSPE